MNATALLLTGTVGSGKTTTAERIGERLKSNGMPHAVVDLDAIRQFWPAPGGDPFGSAMELQNLGALVANYVGAGARRLVLAGVCESKADRTRYERVLAVPLTVCRLRVDADTVDHRLRERHRHDDIQLLQWHRERAGELDRVLDQADVADMEVAVGQRSRDEVADAVLSLLAWT